MKFSACRLHNENANWIAIYTRLKHHQHHFCQLLSWCRLQSQCEMVIPNLWHFSISLLAIFGRKTRAAAIFELVSVYFFHNGCLLSWMAENCTVNGQMKGELSLVHPCQMPEPPQLASFYTKERGSYFQVTRMSKLLTLSRKRSPAIPCRNLIPSACICGPRPLGHNLELVTRGSELRWIGKSRWEVTASN